MNDNGLVRLYLVAALVMALLLVPKFRRHPPEPAAKATNPASLSVAAPEARPMPLPVAADPLEKELGDLMAKMEAEVAQLPSGHPGEAQMMEMQNFVEGLDPAEVPEAAKKLEVLLAAHPSIAGENLEMRLLNRWTASSPADALAWAQPNLSGDSRQEWLDGMMDIWAKQDFSSALAWAQQLPPGTESRSILASAIYQGLYVDPVKAINLAMTLPTEEGRDSLITQAAGQWADAAPQNAADWAASIKDATLKAQVVSSIAMEWGNTDPVSAATLAVNSLPQGDLQDNTLVAIVQRWALSDQTAAQDWVNQFPPGDVRTRAEEAIAEVARRSHMVN